MASYSSFTGKVSLWLPYIIRLDHSANPIFFIPACNKEGYTPNIAVIDYEWLKDDCHFDLCSLAFRQKKIKTLPNAAALLAISKGAQTLTVVKDFASNSKSYDILRHLMRSMGEFDWRGFTRVVYPVSKVFPNMSDNTRCFGLSITIRPSL